MTTTATELDRRPLAADAAAPDLRTELPGPAPRRSSPATRRSPARRSPACTRSSCAAAAGACSRTSTATASSTSTPASPSSPPVTPTPEVNAAIHAQVDDVLHYCSSDFFLPAYTDLCERLARLAPMPSADHGVRVFLCNSGTEAVEAALKLCPPPHRRPNVIAFLGAFHGRSLGSLSLTASKARQRAGFGVVTPGSFHAPYWDPYDADALTGAAYIEDVLFTHASPIPPTWPPCSSSRSRARAATSSRPTSWLADLRALCDRHGIMLVVDEVQSGIGRTGTMWACQRADGSVIAEPDIMCIGKGLASGLPLAGIVARAEIMDWEPGGHGSTFGGNPVACAAANVTLDLVERELAANAATVGAHLLAALRRRPARPRRHRGRARPWSDDRHRPAATTTPPTRSRRRASGAAC